jgi:hypothetical protein
VVLAVVQLACLCPSAAALPPSRPDPDEVEYREIVDSYRAGDTAAAMRRVAAWKGRRLLETARRIRLWHERDPRLLESDEERIAAACLLHLELLRSRPDDALPAELPVIGEHLASLRASPAPSSLAADVHLAVALQLQATLRLEDLRLHFQAMGHAFRSDARLLLAEGTLYETLASRRLEPARRAGLAPGLKTCLESAAGLLRSAIQAEPGQSEARLRLAHVLILQGKDEEALGLLDGLPANGASTSTRYLAHMLAGRAYGDGNRLPDAARAFAAGHDALPCAQSAAIALAHRAFLEGRPADARSVLARPLTADRCLDPWALYDFGPAQALDGLIERIRRRVAR